MQDLAGVGTTRCQQTLQSAVSISGYGLFHGVDVSVELCPAPENHGLRFRRTDLPQAEEIPATIDHVVPVPRRTAVGLGDARVETIEHLLAALSACRVDNCLIRMNAQEVPNCDGSSLAFLEAIDRAGIARQSAKRACLTVRETVLVTDGIQQGVAAQPPLQDEFSIGYVLDYGAGSLPRQSFNVVIDPEVFRSAIGFARTFVLQSEIQKLHATGLGLRATTDDVVVIGESGPVDTQWRCADECVRHKILDCIGDFALAGCDLRGRFTAHRSGHRLNHELIRNLLRAARQEQLSPGALKPHEIRTTSNSIRTSRIAG